MKSFLYLIFLIILFLFSSIIIYLSTVGFETSKFNNIIIQEIKKKSSKSELKLEKVKIKINLKKFQFFLSTSNPKLEYNSTKVPVTEIKIYSKISKIFKKRLEISKIIFSTKSFKTQNIKKIAIHIKPSNFKTYLLNNIQGGEIEKALFDLSIDKNFKITDYKASGAIKNINSKILKDLTIKNISFNFKVDNDLILINSVNANYKGILISNGSIDVERKKEIEIKGKFNSLFELREDQLSKFFTKVDLFKKNKIVAEGTLFHDFNLKINNNFKIIDYDYKSNGNISQSSITLIKNFKNKFFKKPIKKILLEKTKIKIALHKKNKNFVLLDGFYSFDSLNFLKFKVKNNLSKNKKNYFIDFDLKENILLDLINFQTDTNKTSNIKADYSIKNKNFTFNSIDFTEDKNSIAIKDLVINNKNEIEKLSSIKILTFKKDVENNNFIVNFGEKISISGKKYDASNLLKLLSNKSETNQFKNFSKEVEVQIKNLTTKSNVPLNNFRLIALLEKGKFSKISSKSEFTKGKYLDVSLKKDPNNNKKILEVYSDIPQALLSDYKFFEGIKDGKLLYNSIIDETGSTSKLTIENFKVIKAPAFATLLTLADFGGVADLLSGQGMSFDVLEINLKDNINVTIIEEILALGPSVSLHMKGYIEKKTGLISFNGTLVPAKMLNSLVSKIPVVGNILVGKKVGDGVFGVSFKIKGLPGKVKTVVNPVKTITPRFITRALEKIKKK
jgi:hypothetical protein